MRVIVEPHAVAVLPVKLSRPFNIAALALYFMYYNSWRVHQTLRVTPAMEARVSDHVWTLEEIASLSP